MLYGHTQIGRMHDGTWRKLSISTLVREKKFAYARTVRGSGKNSLQKTHARNLLSMRLGHGQGSPEGISKYLSTRPLPKREIVRKKILAMLCEQLLENQHHEDYSAIIKELIEELIRNKQVIQLRYRLLAVMVDKEQ